MSALKGVSHLRGASTLATAVTLGLLAAAAALAACQEPEEVLPTATPAAETTPPDATPTVLPSPTATTAASPTAPSGTATPVPLPSPVPGYTWWVAPPLSPEQEQEAPWLRRYALQLPTDWGQQASGPYLGNPMTFVPEGIERKWPYPAVPQLTVVVASVSVEFPHPFIFQVGRQGGGGCSGDVSAGAVAPSANVAVGGYTWDVYVFTCHQETGEYLPGVTYDGRAAETRAGELVIGIVVLEPVGTTAMQAAFQQALSGFALQ